MNQAQQAQEAEVFARVVTLLERFSDSQTWPEITLETTLEGDLGMDSLERADLEIAVEEEFKFQRPNDAPAFTNIREIVACVLALEGKAN